LGGEFNDTLNPNGFKINPVDAPGLNETARLEE
jgi:hypothetical protein